MKAKEKKMLVKHLDKDDKEFRAQIKDDQVLKKKVLDASKKGKKKKWATKRSWRRLQKL